MFKKVCGVIYTLLKNGQFTYLLKKKYLGIVQVSLLIVIYIQIVHLV